MLSGWGWLSQESTFSATTRYWWLVHIISAKCCTLTICGLQWRINRRNNWRRSFKLTKWPTTNCTPQYMWLIFQWVTFIKHLNQTNNYQIWFRCTYYDIQISLPSSVRRRCRSSDESFLWQRHLATNSTSYKARNTKWLDRVACFTFRFRAWATTISCKLDTPR